MLTKAFITLLFRFPAQLSANKFEGALILARWMGQFSDPLQHSGKKYKLGDYLSRLNQVLWYLEQDGFEVDDRFCRKLLQLVLEEKDWTYGSPS